MSSENPDIRVIGDQVTTEFLEQVTGIFAKAAQQIQVFHNPLLAQQMRIDRVRQFVARSLNNRFGKGTYSLLRDGLNGKTGSGALCIEILSYIQQQLWGNDLESGIVHWLRTHSHKAS